MDWTGKHFYPRLIFLIKAGSLVRLPNRLFYTSLIFVCKTCKLAHWAENIFIVVKC